MMKKRLLSALLSLAMVVTMAPMAFAADTADEKPWQVEGGEKFDSLEAAVKAANGNGTITLLKDYAETQSGVSYDLSGITLDLGGKTYTSSSGLEVVGTKSVLKNGTVAGIKIDAGSVVELENMTVNSDKDKAVEVESNCSVTINGGTFTAMATNNTDAYAVYAEGNLTIHNGTFTATAESGTAYSVYVCAANSNSKGVALTITGGKFDGVVLNDDGKGTKTVTGGYYTDGSLADWYSYIPNYDKTGGYTVVASEDAKYDYKVVPVNAGDDYPDNVIVQPLDDGITTTRLNVNIVRNGVEGQQAQKVRENAKQLVETAYEEQPGMKNQQIILGVIIRWDVTNATSSEYSISMDIAPKYKVVASVDENEAGITTIPPVTVVEEQDMQVDTPTKVTLTLPEDFVTNENQKIYIKHEKNDKTYLYDGKLTAAEDTFSLAFTSLHGFSPFTITTVQPAVTLADADGVITAYNSLQEAADAAENGAEITVNSGNSHELTFTTTKSVKVKNNTDADNITVKFNGTDKAITKGATETFSYTKPSSGGSSSSGSGSSGTTTYKVTTSAVSNGSVKTSVSAAAKGATVTLTLSPDKGYTLDKLTVTDASGNSISTTKKSDAVYTFTMPASQVKVGVTYVKEDPTVVEPTTSFTDVTSTDWFAEAVKYVADKGMMNGTSKTTFGPKSGTTRGMIVTVLYRLENEPSTSATSFTDVASDAYYANAVAWANVNGVVSGYGNSKFGPNDSITREQLAAILYRYAQYKKYDVSVGEDTNIMDFDDVRQISSYAVPAIQWACGAGVMTGKSTTTLDPNGGATRAEVAAMLMRFCENVK